MSGLNCLPTSGFSIKPPKARLLAWGRKQPRDDVPLETVGLCAKALDKLGLSCWHHCLVRDRSDAPGRGQNARALNM